MPREVMDSSPLDPSWRVSFYQCIQYEDNGEIHQITDTLWMRGGEKLEVWAKDKHLQHSRSHQATGTRMVILFLHQFSKMNKQLRFSHAAPSPPMMHSYLGQTLVSQMLTVVRGIIYAL